MGLVVAAWLDIGVVDKHSMPFRPGLSLEGGSTGCQKRPALEALGNENRSHLENAADGFSELGWQHQ